MSARVCTGLIFLLSAINCLGQTTPGGCLSYEPTVVALHGKLTRIIFAGQPNYEDVRKGDHAEPYWILNLDSPICLNEDKSDFNLSRKHVRKVQLVMINDGMYHSHSPLLGKKVVAIGTLFGAHTGHHHTSVLLIVKSLEQ